MPVNKVVYGNNTVMDISDSTVTEATLAEGAVAYDKAGNRIVGTMKSSEDLTAELDAQETKLNALVTSLEGKAAGGGGVETCTVSPYLINGTYYGDAGTYYATVLRDGAITNITGTWNTQTGTISDVVCGSVFCITASSKGGVQLYGGATLISTNTVDVFVSMPSKAGADVQIFATADIV